MTSRRTRLRLLLMVPLLWVITTGPLRADPVNIEGRNLTDFSRLTFQWPAPVAYQVSVNDNRLDVLFARPIQTTFNALLEALPGVVSSASVAANGRGVTVMLNGTYDAIGFAEGGTISIDLIPRNAVATTAPSLPSPLADTLPLVPVRSGEHSGYSRLVFDWPQWPQYQLRRDADQVTIQFGKPARIQLGRLTQRLPRRLRSITAQATPEGPLVVLELAPNSTLRELRSGESVVIDVLAAAPPQPTPEPAPTPAPAPAPERQAESPAQPAPASDEPPAPAAQPTTTVEQQPLESTDGTTAAALPFTWEFKWDEPVAAAVFRRGTAVWLVFDKAVQINTEALTTLTRGAVSRVQQAPSNDATILRATVPTSLNPQPSRNGLSWIFTFSEGPQTPTNTVNVAIKQDDMHGVHAAFDVPQPGYMVAVRDPEVGDNLLVTPVIPLGYGVAQRRRFPDFDVLPSFQGIVLRPRADNLAVQGTNNRILVTADGGLHASVLNEKQAALAQDTEPPLSNPHLIFNEDIWKQTAVYRITRTRQSLQQEAAAAETASERKAARLKLAEFFISIGFGQEAHGVLQVALAEDQTLASNPKFLAIRGAANFLMARYKDSRKDFLSAPLKDNDEAEFWAAAALSALNQGAKATVPLQRGGNLMTAYPPTLRLKLGEFAIQAMLEVKSVEQSNRFLKLMTVQRPTPAERGLINYYEARKAQLEENYPKATEKYEAAENSPHLRIAALAKRDRVEMLLERKEITPAEAIEELEKLRFSWRGDKFEFDLLNRLADLYIAQGEYRDGMQTLRQVATYFRDQEMGINVPNKMSNIFVELYGKGKADSLQPLTAIALFEEFKELTPPGPEGDQMIRQLADRLFKVDLLDRAAELLRNQVEFRLKGLERTRVGTKLALLSFLNGDMADALNVLEQTELSDIPEDLRTTRRHLRSRALIKDGKQQQALDLLQGDNSREANLIRIQSYWDAGDWANATPPLRALVIDSGGRPKAALDETQARYVMALTVAMTLSGNERGIAQVARDYQAAMNETPYKDVFSLLATSPENGIPDYRAIEQKVSQVEGLTDFLGDYRQQLALGDIAGID